MGLAAWNKCIGEWVAWKSLPPEIDITDIRTILRSAENWNVLTQLLDVSAALVIFIIKPRPHWRMAIIVAVPDDAVPGDYSRQATIVASVDEALRLRET